MIPKTFTLNNKYEMPTIGLGTWQITDYDQLEASIMAAIEKGYRHIDTAFAYFNEDKIGKILKKIFKEGKIKREDLFITSKLWNSFHKNPRMALEKTLKDLQLDYLDLYLIHWPITYKVDKNYKPIIKNNKNLTEEFEVEKIWKEMESFVKEGKVRSIGLCNSDEKICDRILAMCEIKPQIAQFELHPYNTKNKLVKYYQDNNIEVVSYSSLGSTQKNEICVISDPVITSIAKKYNKTVSQVILSYIVMRKMFVIPKSVNKDHINENFELFELDEDDFKKIDSLDKGLTYILPPLGGIDF